MFEGKVKSRKGKGQGQHVEGRVVVVYTVILTHFNHNKYRQNRQNRQSSSIIPVLRRASERSLLRQAIHRSCV